MIHYSNTMEYFPILRPKKSWDLAPNSNTIPTLRGQHIQFSHIFITLFIALGSSSATGFAAVDCSHNIWSETIVRNQSVCLFSAFNSRDTHWLSDRLHIISEFHLELGPLRTIDLPANQAQETINKCLQKNGKRWTNSKIFNFSRNERQTPFFQKLMLIKLKIPTLQ